MSAEPPPPGPMFDGDASVELSSNRTALSFERTHMSADRTLMSTVRTSLSLIGFGFTIYETFHQLAANEVLTRGDLTGRRVGASLLTLGIVLLALGIRGHMRFSKELTGRRSTLVGHRLLRHAVTYSATPTFISASLLLFIGMATLISILVQMFT